MTPIRTVITGVSGRMGALLVRLVRDHADFVLHGGTDKPGSAAIGLDVGLAAHLAPLEVSTVDSLASVLAQANVVIDFTTPEASVAHARLCAEAGVPLVVGSTGFSAEAKGHMAEAAKRIPLVMAPNMSVGVNLVIELAAMLARRLGDDFDVEVMETHHRMKKDAPSGTAMRLAEELAKALGREQDDIRTSRVGQIGERPRKEIGVQTLRGGDVVGEHTVFFFGDGERVELTHRATSREQFGRGALRAARWIIGRQPGLYGMPDVLGLG
ncbi:MAG: 4-hydroxy-tetrahydrodipicolinate reductase [Myxococcota bacterium]